MATVSLLNTECSSIFQVILTLPFPMISPRINTLTWSQTSQDNSGIWSAHIFTVGQWMLSQILFLGNSQLMHSVSKRIHCLLLVLLPVSWRYPLSTPRNKDLGNAHQVWDQSFQCLHKNLWVEILWPHLQLTTTSKSEEGREERKKEGGWQEKGTVGSGFLPLRGKRRVTRNK